VHPYASAQHRENATVRSVAAVHVVPVPKVDAPTLVE
jgi:hypothetical protein